MPNRYFLVPEWEYDFWRFKSKAYNGTKLIVSGWNMIIKSEAPVKRYQSISMHHSFEVYCPLFRTALATSTINYGDFLLHAAFALI